MACKAASKRTMDAMSTSMRLSDNALQSPACPWPAAESCVLSLLLCLGSSAGNMYVMAITMNAHSALWQLRKLVWAISLQSVCHEGMGPRLTRMPRGPSMSRAEPYIREAAKECHVRAQSYYNGEQNCQAQCIHYPTGCAYERSYVSEIGLGSVCTPSRSMLVACPGRWPG